MLALDTCGEQAEKEENRRVPHVRLGHKTTLHVSKIGLTRVTRLGARHSGTSMASVASLGAFFLPFRNTLLTSHALR